MAIKLELMNIKFYYEDNIDDLWDIYIYPAEPEIVYINGARQSRQFVPPQPIQDIIKKLKCKCANNRI